jgi:hypothetical protein
MRLPRLDLFLAGGIAEHEDQRHRLIDLGVDLDAARKVRAAALRGPLRGSEDGARAMIAFFGRPAVRRVERVAWDLVLWPGHQFERSLREWGGEGEMVRRGDASDPVPDEPGSLEALRLTFRPWHHTRRDVMRVLGDPLRSIGADPHERHDWRLADGAEVALEFAHGLLLRMGAAPPPPAPRRPWWAFWRRGASG